MKSTCIRKQFVPRKYFYLPCIHNRYRLLALKSFRMADRNSTKASLHQNQITNAVK